jgi:YVTN family beta-propeller protein/autotransporter-associated beta strand protein
MQSHRVRAVATRGARRHRRAPDAFRFGGSIRLAAIVRPAMTRGALLGGVWLGALAAGATEGAHAQQGPFLYVPNSASNSVTVIDTPTNTTVPPAIAVGALPVTAAVRGDESLVYVTNQNGNSVSVINTATNTVVATIAGFSGLSGVAVSPDGTRAYVTNQNLNSVSVINTATNTVVRAPIAVGVAPLAVAFSPDGTRAYVANSNSNNVSVINTATNTVVGAIPVGASPVAVAFSPDGTRAYVADTASGSVSVINTTTNTVVTTVNVGANPHGVAVSPDSTHLYVANTISNNVSVLNTATNTVVATITGLNTPVGVVFSPDGTRAYVTSNNGGNVSVIDTATNTIVGAPIPVGNNPAFLGICSNGNALLSSGLTFKANTSGALACTLASGPGGASGPVFTGGTLQIAGANITSALPITLQSQGGTIDTNGNNATLSGTISGPGSLTKLGAGVLTLSGSNSYSGGTALNAGTLAVGSSSALGTGDLTFASGTTLQAAVNGLSLANAMTLNGTSTVDTQTSALTLSGNIVGSGGLTKIGAGTLTLSGPSTYTGATNVNAGTLQAGVANAFSPLSAFTVAAGATLDLNNFDQNVGSLAGAGAVTLGAATLFTGSDNTSTTFSGTISGSGGLTKIGPGMLTLSGTSTYSGLTMIAGGLVNFNAASNFGTGAILLNGGGLQWAAGTSTDISPRLAAFGVGGATFDTNGNTVTLASALSGIGGVTKVGAGALTLSGTDT